MIREVQGLTPRVHPDAYVDPQAAVIGDVTIDAGASVWPFTVLRGDQDNYVRLGKNSNVQDNSVLHVTPQHPCIVGDNVTIGHRAVVHACTIMDNCRIGIGAVVLNGAVVEAGDRKSTRLNSSHGYISYAVFCLKKKKKKTWDTTESKQTS